MQLIYLSLLLAGILATPAVAQESAEDAETLRDERIAIEEQMREAEEQLAEAALRIAELTQRNMPIVAPDVQMLFEQDDTPRLGVTLSSSSDEGPVEGVTLTGITPGSAAAEAGLRAGDVLTAINTQSLAADSTREANDKLVNFMSRATHGDKVEIEYLRDGNTGKLTLTPRAPEMRRFVFRGKPGETFDFYGGTAPGAVGAPDIERELVFAPSMRWAGKTWSDMELVELSAGLGEYFGTKSGVLVVRAPEENVFKLQDGDVVVAVDGREPESVGHLLRILASYAAGESLELKIMRNKKSQTIKLTMPAERVGSLFPMPPRAPVRPLPAPDAQTPGLVSD